MHPNSLWNSNAPLVIAHRGASLRAPENTLASFRLAVELGADAVELDAKMTTDGYVVVHHDQTLDRTTTGTGPLSARTLEEVRRLDAGSHFDLNYAGEQIPTLREVFRAVADRLLINIELTNYASTFDSLPEVVIKLVHEFGLERRVLLSSFNFVALRKARKIAPEIPLALILHDKEPRWLRGLFCRLTPHEAFHPSMSLVSEELIHNQQHCGRRVNVWTVNDAKSIKALVRWGVNGVITDVPDMAREILHEALSERVSGQGGLRIG